MSCKDSKEQMAKKTKTIKLAVREFAEPFLRTGSIDARSQFSLVDPIRGGEIHRQMQKRRAEEDPTYQREISINHKFEHKDWQIEIVGRIDGLATIDNQTVVEEIKSTYSLGRLLNRLSTDHEHPYVRQAQLYAYMLYRQNTALPAPRVRILAVSAHTGLAEAVDIPFDEEDFAIWFAQRCDEIIAAEILRQERVAEWQAIGKELDFPFAQPRPEQMPLIEQVSTNVETSGKLLLQAPTGLGKSIGVLYPAMKEALSRGAKVIYTTPKNSQHAIAEHALAQWHEKGINLRSVTVNAKQKLCMKDEVNCNPEYCEFAKDHYDKVNEHQLLTKLRDESRLSADTFKAYAEQYKVCPYELTFQAMPEANLIVADYNYVFSPGATIESRSQLPLATSSTPNLVIDEAHNLYTRAMDYFSPSLSLRHLEDLRSRLNPFADEARDLISKCIELVVEHRPKKLVELAIVPVQKKRFDQLAKLLVTFLAEHSEELQADSDSGQPDAMVELYWAWSSFTEVLNLADEAFFCSYQNNETGEVLQIHCCDASNMLEERYKAFKSVTAFSATLKPFEFYARVLGFDLANDKTAEFRSPFPIENRKLMIIPQISTAYRDRASNYAKIAQVINRVLSLRTGNYFVFFPSFEFLRNVAPLVDLPEFEVIEQTYGMSNKDARALLERFLEPNKRLVVLGVQGGTFAEGIDLPGEHLIGSIIVGPAIPPFDVRREKLREYYTHRYGVDGFDYAYTYPAMARVVQAAGRVIRTEEDRGLIVLLDRRFLQESYAKSMPDGWFDDSPQELVSNKILEDVSEFWQRAPGPDQSP